MVISNIEIMGLESSMIAAGYPVRTETGLRELKDNDYKRVFQLTKKSRKNQNPLEKIESFFFNTF